MSESMTSGGPAAGPSAVPASPQAPGAMPGGPDPIHPAIAQTHSAASAQYDATSKAMGNITALRSQLDSLVAKGDAVTAEDVIERAGMLAAKGLDPHALATVLSGMPEGGGQALSGWLRQQDEALRTKEAQLAPMHALAQHKLGVAAFHGLASLSLAQHARALAGAQPSPAVGGPLHG